MSKIWVGLTIFLFTACSVPPTESTVDSSLERTESAFPSSEAASDDPMATLTHTPPDAKPKPSAETPSPEASSTLSMIDIAYGPDERHRLDIFYRDDLENAPVIVLIHSGIWAEGDKLWMHSSPRDLLSLGSEYPEDLRAFAARWAGSGREFAQFFVDLGFVAATPNHRLVKEDGMNAFPAPVNDIGCAAAWLNQNAGKFGGDPSRMYVMGYSSGAHIGAMLAYNPERDWLEECPITDEELNFKGFIGLAGAYDFAVLSRAHPQACWLLSDLLSLDEGSMFPCLTSDTGLVTEANPVDLVTPDDPPALLVTGDFDCILNIRNPDTGTCMGNTLRFGSALEENGISVEVLVLAGKGHGPDGVLDIPVIGDAIVRLLEQAP